MRSPNRRALLLWLPAALMIVILPVTLALAGQETHPWRLTWMIPLALAGTWIVIGPEQAEPVKITVSLDEARELAGAVTGPLRELLLAAIVDHTEDYFQGTCVHCHHDARAL